MIRRQDTRIGELRPSQMISTFGVGSMVDLPHVSAIVMGTEEWAQTGKVLSEPRLLAAVQRRLQGRSTVRDLLHAKQEVIVARGRGERIDMSDFRMGTILARRGYHLDSVIPSGETVRLLDNANLSTGGDSHDVTPHVHPDFMNIAVSATRDMGLRLCGVDILTDDITRPMTDYRIIEMNGAP